MSDSWIVSVSGRAYGPYSAAQLEAFIKEGRVVPHSLVARPGDMQFHPASDEPELAELFRPVRAQAIAETMHPDEPAAAKKFGRGEEEHSDGPGNFLIIADMKSQSIAALEQEIFNLGPAYPVMPQAWIVSCDQSASAVRNLLIQKLGKIDLLFVVDASHNKAAWYNYAPEADTKIRRIWYRPAELKRAG